MLLSLNFTQNKLISVRAVGQALVDSAYGGSGCLGQLLDLGICLILGKEFGNLEPLSDGMNLVNGTDIFEKSVAFFFVL
jgi:hypothetical protein